MNVQISRARGRSTRAFRALREQVLATSDVCGICGHPGSDSVDHIVARSVDPTMAEDIDNLQPAHNSPCPTCGQRCQRIKGTRPMAQAVPLKTSRQW